MTAKPFIVFYDGRCRLCARSRRTLQSLDSSDVVRFIDINDDQAMSRFPLVDRQAAQGQIHVLDPRGQLTGGYDALVELTPVLPSLRSLAPLLRWKPMRALGRRIYQSVARNRYRFWGRMECDTACAVR